MDIDIRGININVSPEMEEFTQRKLSKLNRYLPNIRHIHVEYAMQNSSRGRDIIIAQITIRHDRGAILRAEERIEFNGHDTPKQALTGAVDKMYRRIRRFKGKSKTKRARERYGATAEELELAEALPNAEAESVDETDEFDELAREYETDVEPVIVRRKSIAVTAMHEEEAIEQMELLGHQFFVYFDADANQVNVVYRRDNGGYGVLVPHVG